MVGDGTGRTRRQGNGPASGVLTRGRLGWKLPGQSAASLPGAPEPEVRRRGMGIKISPQRGAARLPKKNRTQALGAPQSSFLMRYRPLAYLSAWGKLFDMISRVRAARRSSSAKRLQ